MDLFDQILELSEYGYFCSQIMAVLLLQELGEENEAFVRAMGGLCGGIGYSEGCCGCMTGGCCMISYFTGKGDRLGEDHPLHKQALKEFTDWFTEEMQTEYGSTDCREIIGGNPANRVKLCPQIIAASFDKCATILTEKGILS